ncbi:MAG: MYG1 family protein [Candidatus Bathyarchaeia archaeon]
MKIYTHAGVGHADDFLAVCLLLNKFPDAVVERVSAPNLNEDAIFVDVGGKYEPPKFLDHHQDEKIPSSFALVLEHYYDIPVEKLPKNYFFYDLKDRVGVKAACETMRIGPSLPSPVETSLLSLFSKKNKIAPGDPFHSIMIELGKEVIEEIKNYVTVPEKVGDVIETPEGVIVLVKDPYIQVSFLKEYFDRLIAMVKPNSRDPKLTDLVSIDNNPYFRPSEHLKDVETAFQHPTGFMRSVKADLESTWSLLKQEYAEKRTLPS